MRKRNVLLALGVAVLIVGGTTIQPSSGFWHIDGTKIPQENATRNIIRYTTDKDFEIVKGDFYLQKNLKNYTRTKKYSSMLQGCLK